MEWVLLQVPGGVIGLSGVLVGSIRHAPPDAASSVPVPVLGHGIGDFRNATTVGPGIGNLAVTLVIANDLRKCVTQTAEVHGICSNHRISELANKATASGSHVIDERELFDFNVIHGVGWLGLLLAAI